MKKVEYLSDDILEKEFIKQFKPYFFMQKLLGSCRVDVRDRFVSSPTKYQKLYTIITGMIILSSEFRVYFERCHKYAKSYRFMYFMCILLLSMHIQSYIGNIIHVRFLNASENAKLYLILQRIDRSLKLNLDLELNSLQYRIHTFTLIIITLVAICLSCYVAVFGDRPELLLTFITLIICESPFIVDLTHCSHLMLYFTTRVNIINSIMWNYLRGKPKRARKRRYFISKSFLRSVAARQHNFESSDTDKYLRDIFTCFKLYTNLYRYQILLLCCKFCLYALTTFEFILLSIQYNVIDRLEIVTLGTVIILHLITVLFLSVRSELFFRAIKETKGLSITIMSIHLQGPLREKARKMYKLIEDTPPRFSVYDMWNMDARVVLALFNFVTNFIVTLFQLTYL